MLTATIILADDDLKSIIEGDEVFSQWQFRASSWDDVYEVNVPDLSQKERYLINGLISSATEGTSIHERIRFVSTAKTRNRSHFSKTTSNTTAVIRRSVGCNPSSCRLSALRQRWTMQQFWQRGLDALQTFLP